MYASSQAGKNTPIHLNSFLESDNAPEKQIQQREGRETRGLKMKEKLRNSSNAEQDNLYCPADLHSICL